MGKETEKNIKLGTFVLLGTAFLIIGLYYIGEKKNLFGSTFRIAANFQNVNGLSAGNNVRFGGINIGTVKNIEILNDSTVRVDMLIKNKTKVFIKKNALASIGTDGLMGNKLVNINSVSEPSGWVEDGDLIQSLSPLETDNMFRTLNRTNNDVSIIAANLKTITDRLNKSSGIWNLITDTLVSADVKTTLKNIKLTTNRTAQLSNSLIQIIDQVKAGKGNLGILLNDSSYAYKLSETLDNLMNASDSLIQVSSDLTSFSQKLKKGEGIINTIIKDTLFVHNVNKSLENIKNGTKGFSENMEALKHNFLFRSYFKKQEMKKDTNSK